MDVFVVSRYDSVYYCMIIRPILVSIKDQRGRDLDRALTAVKAFLSAFSNVPLQYSTSRSRILLSSILLVA